MKFYTKILLILLILTGAAHTLYAQNTVVRGTVTDAKTKEALSFVTIGFAGSTQGAATDVNG
jgi:hypothetical protein